MKLPQRTHDTWCRHRTPFDKDIKTCKAGVDFHQFTGNYALMPCLGESEEAKARCPKYAPWTKEEQEAFEAAHNLRWERMKVIRAAIVEAINKKTLPRQGQMPCPACKEGTVGYSVASNGHVHARCSTEGCAAWME